MIQLFPLSDHKNELEINFYLTIWPSPNLNDTCISFTGVKFFQYATVPSPPPPPHPLLFLFHHYEPRGTEYENF